MHLDSLNAWLRPPVQLVPESGRALYFPTPDASAIWTFAAPQDATMLAVYLYHPETRERHPEWMVSIARATAVLEAQQDGLVSEARVDVAIRYRTLVQLEITRLIPNGTMQYAEVFFLLTRGLPDPPKAPNLPGRKFARFEDV